MKSIGTLLLTRKEVSALLTIEECIKGVEEAFKLRALGLAQAPGILGISSREGGFHIKAGILKLGREYFVAKTNANFPHNMKKNGLPTIQGVIVVCDALDGRLLALMDSMEITIIRTGAATAVAAKYLANPHSKVMTICGCGNQGRVSIKSILAVLPIETIYVYDIDETIASDFAKEASRDFNVHVQAVTALKKALSESDICITCTPARKFYLDQGDIRAGTFIAAVGADNEDKQELDPHLVKTSKLIVDSVDQAAKIGELHHALEQGVMKREDVAAELGEVIAGKKPGRASKDEIIIFDSTGTALQDVAAAAVVYENAIGKNLGLRLDFGE